ncbi:hypothetical protein BC830DRAFT_1080887 [Chytriomyces sp. MP71]|nr:hypothetical protein BC830DRAFT_1080887 [Chytriomyces sp. MP71]
MFPNHHSHQMQDSIMDNIFEHRQFVGHADYRDDDDTPEMTWSRGSSVIGCASSTISESDACNTAMLSHGDPLGTVQWPLLGKPLMMEPECMSDTLDLLDLDAMQIDSLPATPNTPSAMSDASFCSIGEDKADMFYGMALELVSNKGDLFRGNASPPRRALTPSSPSNFPFVADKFKSCAVSVLTDGRYAKFNGLLQKGQSKVNAKLSHLAVEMSRVHQAHKFVIGSVDSYVEAMVSVKNEV